MKDKHSIPVLSLGSGATSLSVIYDLSVEGVPVIHLSTKSNDVALRSRRASERVLLPSPQTESAKLLEALMNAPQRWKGALLVPTVDPAVRFVAENYEVLKDRFLIAGPPWKVLQKIVDKDLLYKEARRANVPCPDTLSPESPDLVTAVPSLLGYPCILKPHQSPNFFAVTGSKALEIRDEGELRERISLAKQHALDVMLSEIIPGPEDSYYSYRAYISNSGQVVADLCTQKVRHHPVHYGVGAVQRTVPMIPELRDLSLSLLRSVGFTGLANVEFKQDARDQRFKLIEVNPRPPLCNRLFRAAGINFVYLMYLDMTAQSMPAIKDYQSNVYIINNVGDLYEFKRHLRRGLEGMVAYLRPYLARNVYTVPFYLNDPLPFLASMKRVIGSTLTKRR